MQVTPMGGGMFAQYANLVIKLDWLMWEPAMMPEQPIPDMGTYLFIQEAGLVLPTVTYLGKRAPTIGHQKNNLNPAGLSVLRLDKR